MLKSLRPTKNSLAKTIKIYSQSLSDPEFQKLNELFLAYGRCRSMFFNQFCGINNMIKINHFYQIRNEIRKSGLSKKYTERYHFLGKHWIYALYDSCANIKSMWSNTANQIRIAIRDNDNINGDEQHYLFFILKFPILWQGVLLHEQQLSYLINQKYRLKFLKIKNKLTTNQIRHAHSYLSRLTRRYKATPHKNNHHNKSMTYDENMYRFSNQRLFRFSSNQNRQVFSVTLTTDWHYRKTGNIQIILDRIHHRIAIHKLIQTHTHTLKLSQPIGIDKGLATLLSCSNGHEYGYDFGQRLTTEVERLCKVNAQRNYQRIKGYSSGLLRYERRKQRTQAELHALINNTIYQFLLTEKPKVVVKEDLTFNKESLPKCKSKRIAKTRRKLNSWTKGYLNQRLEYLCSKFNIPFVDVNPAYTSQYCPNCHQHFLKRYGIHHELVLCRNCGKMNANIAAAKNILNRKDNHEIGLYTPYLNVKKLLDQCADQTK